jgi:F420-dependent oxidoreductase-like protein
MEVFLFIEPHRGASYEEQLTFAKHAEQCGYLGLLRADHYQSFGSSDGRPGPTDAWVTLGALARETSRLRLGTLMTSTTFRLPGPLAIAVAQVDKMSNGRIELGLGAGWYRREHQSYGVSFPAPAERLSRLAEQIEIITGLWRTPLGETFTYQGRFYHLAGAPALPRPAQTPGPPIIVGGRGTHRTPEIAARYAAEFNATFLSPQEAALRFRLAVEACERLGRSGGSLSLSGGIPVACGRSDSEARRRAEVLREPESALPTGEAAVIGPPEALVERIGELGQAGAQRAYLRLSDLTDLAHLDLIASEVLPKVAH